MTQFLGRDWSRPMSALGQCAGAVEVNACFYRPRVGVGRCPANGRTPASSKREWYPRWVLAGDTPKECEEIR
jgi:hypothetical protein